VHSDRRCGPGRNRGGKIRSGRGGPLRAARRIPAGRERVKWNFMSEEENSGQIPLPPASFTFIVLSLRAQAEMQLGMMDFGTEEKVKPDLEMARHTIDLMAVLQQKSKGNLTLEE